MTQIITAPSPVLRQVTQPVKAVDRRIQKVLQTMEKALKAAKEPQGVGLAAPQIGEPLQIFMIRPKSNGSITTFINPEITNFSQTLTKPTGKNGIYEGCLSIPNHYAPIIRSKSVTVKYLTQEFVEKVENFSGFAAHVIQHEMDHLNGILFIDRCLEQNAKLFKIIGEEWEEVGI